MNRINFELTPQQLEIKNLLNKDFLELEIWAISDIYPNRNNTYFTKESLERAIPSCKNKPILGLFTKGDFASHEGKMQKDRELNNGYWDTTNGEQILGFIRESDLVEVVEKDGLDWLHFTCVLCLKYCYKQAKRLLQDKFKKVSVEVDITDSEEIDGILHIYDFDLAGVTILGTKNGRPVLEGIPDAHLNVLALINEEQYQGQRQALCFAYEEMENFSSDSEDINTKKEGNAVEEELEKEVCPHCGQNPCVCAENEPVPVDKPVLPEEPEVTPAEPEHFEEPAPEEELEESEDHEEDDDNDDKQESDEPEDESEEESDDDDHREEEPKSEPKTYSEEEYLAKCAEFEECNKLKEEFSCKLEESERLRSECEAQCNAEKEKYEACQKELESCRAELEACKNECSTFKTQIFEYKCSALKAKALSLMEGAPIVDEERTTIEMKCEKGEYTCEEDLAKDVAYAIFKAQNAQKSKQTYAFSMPIINDNSVESKKHETSREERIASYANGIK